MPMVERSMPADVAGEIYRDWSAGRWAGPRVIAQCDWPTCTTQIRRGTAARCSTHGETVGCELFFCLRHRAQYAVHEIVRPKPDGEAWDQIILTDPALASWREQHPFEVDLAQRRREDSLLRDAAQDLARAADRQAARAAIMSPVAQSARLFKLADELRSAAVSLGRSMSKGEVLELLDGARCFVAEATLRLDAADRADG